MNTPLDFVAMIRQLRTEKRWSIGRLARECGMNEVRIGSYERGDRQPPVAVLAEIFEALGYEFRVVPKDSPTDDRAALAAHMRKLADRIEHSHG